MALLIWFLLAPLTYVKFKLHWKYYIGLNDLGKGSKFDDTVLNADLGFFEKFIFMMHFGLPVFIGKSPSNESLPVKKLRIQIYVILLTWWLLFILFLYLLER